MGCFATSGSTRYFYTGNAVGSYNFCGDYNFVSGGGPENGITAGEIVPVYFPDPTERRLYRHPNAQLSQALLDASFPEFDWVWIADIYLNDGTHFRVSDRNVYIKDKEGLPRFYEARAEAPIGLTRTLGEWLQEGFEIGEAQIVVSNYDGLFNPYLPNGVRFQNWTNSKVDIRVGFGEEYSNYFTLYEGYITFNKGREDNDGKLSLRIYDKFQIDQTPLPVRSFTEATYPFIDSSNAGGKIPLVYGDWTDDVTDYGQVIAICTNGAKLNPTSYEFKISDNALESIDAIFLERGEHSETDGLRTPIEIDLNYVTLYLNDGEFEFPSNVPIFAEFLTILESDFAASGSTTDLISSTATNFIDLGVQLGDTVIKLSTGERGLVTTVANFVLNLSGGINWEENDEYRILTKTYKYKSGDKFRIKCKGKPVQVTDYMRIRTATPLADEPVGIDIDYEGFYWLADDTTQKVYKINFITKETVKEIAYSTFNPSMTNCAGISLSQLPSMIWVADYNQAQLYYYDWVTDNLEATLDTSTITGLPAALDSIQDISVDNLGRLWIADDNDQTIYEIEAFPINSAYVVSSFSYSTIDPGITGLQGLGYNVFTDTMALCDNLNQKMYEVDTAGLKLKEFSYDDMFYDITDIQCVAVAQDSTWFFAERLNDVIYNFLPYNGVNTNPGFIARDLLQGYSNRTYADFMPEWTGTSVNQLSQYKCRFVLQDDVTCASYVADLLKQVNTELFVDQGQKYNIFHNVISNYSVNGMLLTEQDMILGSFNPDEELRQYFNSCDSLYKFYPSANTSLRSQTLTSLEGVEFARKTEFRSFPLRSLYRESDVNAVLAERLRQSVPQPELVEVTLSWRCMLLNLTDMVKILYSDGTGGFCPWGSTSSQRRYNNIPGYVRELNFNLKNMTVNAKIRSLGTTEFCDGSYIPPGPRIGGCFGRIGLGAVGRFGYISPSAEITSSFVNTIDTVDVEGQNAESRFDSAVGYAWTPGYKVALYDADANHSMIEINEIASVSGNTITFVNNWTTTINPTVVSDTGLFTGGHYLCYAEYEEATAIQKEQFVWLGRPTDQPAPSISIELEELTGGVYDFDDGGMTYVVGTALDL